MSTKPIAYNEKLREHLEDHKRQQWPELGNGVWMHKGKELEYPHILPKTEYQLNLLPLVRDRFWTWFGKQNGEVKLHRFFHHLNSSQALCFNLFFPFLKEDGTTVDRRLLQVLGVDDQDSFTGHFERVFDKDENTNFDFYLEGRPDQKIFFELKYSEAEFGSCSADERHRGKLERHYRPPLQQLVDPTWLDETTFFKNYQILRNVSYLSRGPKTRLIFIFPKANECLKPAEDVIRKIADPVLGQRVDILYLEDLVQRIIEITKDDPALQQHFQDFEQKYVLAEG